MKEDVLHREEKEKPWPISVVKPCPMMVRLGPIAVDRHMNSKALVK